VAISELSCRYYELPFFNPLAFVRQARFYSQLQATIIFRALLDRCTPLKRSIKDFRATFLRGFRAARILAVLFHNAAAPAEWLPVTKHGFLGVDMFFLLSGFLIVTLLLREKDGYGDISLGSFICDVPCRFTMVCYFCFPRCIWRQATCSGHLGRSSPPFNLHIQLDNDPGRERRDHLVAGGRGAILPVLAHSGKISEKHRPAARPGVARGLNQLINFGLA
jgi:hypothetical protein